MAGRRLLDVASLFQASKAIARQHIALRSQQLDALNRTSSLARAVKNQTDRVTLTAQAAIALSKKLNGVPDNSTVYTKSQEPVPDPHSVREGAAESINQKQGLGQDHHYSPSEQNAARDAPPIDDLEVVQEKPARNPLPDGTIPPDGSILGQTSPSKLGTDTYSERPLDAAKSPLAEQDQKAGVKPIEADHNVILDPTSTTKYAARDARDLQWESEKHIPEVTATDSPGQASKDGLTAGLNEDVFYEPGKQTSSEHSSLPRAKIPKHADVEEGHESIANKGINADVFPDAATDSAQTKFEEAPEGVNLNVFRTSRGSDLLKRRAAKPVEATPAPITAQSETNTEAEMRDLASAMAADNEPSTHESLTAPHKASASLAAEPDLPRYEMRESRVPSSRFGRLWQYAGLGTSMALGAVGEGLRRVTGSGSGGSLVLSPANLERLVAKLSRMRGAALKLGQMVSFQDLKMLPPAIHEVMQRVQDSADYMPASQRNQVLTQDLGPNWSDLFTSFDEKPIAAASIGQVHRAVLASTGQEVAVKVQYPGVATSIDSDLNNLSVLLTASRLLPRGLFLDKTIANARTELAWECDYIREAECATRFRSLVADDTDTFTVPTIYPEASGKQVLTMEMMHGRAVTKIPNLSQQDRDWIGTQILRLCLREIAEFKFMQTDPNWTNFLFNGQTRKLELLDFGASREYPDHFVNLYLGVLEAASKGDRQTIKDLSVDLGYLTGSESDAMANAHTDSVLTLAEPFTDAAPEVYDFRDQTITDRVRGLIPVMIKERQAPPPEETYSLHRKLSGAFLLCARLGSRVACRGLFADAMGKWRGQKL